MNPLIYLKDWWIEAFSPSQLTDCPSEYLLNFDIERSLNIMGIKYSSDSLNLPTKSISYYKVYDLILHWIYWIRYLTFFFIQNQDYWIIMSDISLPFGQYRSWALYLYFLAYTCISGIWYVFESFPITRKYYSWLSWYSKGSINYSTHESWVQLKVSINRIWSLLHWSLIYGAAVLHFALIVSPVFYSTNWLQLIVSLIFALLTMQRVLFIIKVLQMILFLFITFIIICNNQINLWIQIGLELINFDKSIDGNMIVTSNELDLIDDPIDSHLIAYLTSFMTINCLHSSGNRILSRLGGLFYLQTFFSAIINMYIVFFISVSFGVKMTTIVSLFVSISNIIVLLPIICRTVNHSVSFGFEH